MEGFCRTGDLLARSVWTGLLFGLSVGFIAHCIGLDWYMSTFLVSLASVTGALLEL